MLKSSLFTFEYYQLSLYIQPAFSTSENYKNIYSALYGVSDI